jgi:hypothetical protein
MKTQAQTIIGCGLSGMLAALDHPGATVLEQAKDLQSAGHKALLRLRSNELSRFTGEPLQQVVVTKAVWDDGKFSALTPSVANRYSLKCTGHIAPRSISSLDAVSRFIAPKDLAERLYTRIKERVVFGVQVEDVHALPKPVISTAPMPVMAKLAGQEPPSGEAFLHKPIWVSRLAIKHCAVHQTIYFPGEDTPVYRASITGDDLIIEASGCATEEHIAQALVPFGIPPGRVVRCGLNHKQTFGKIVPMADDMWRRGFIAMLTSAFDVYSLGRFATWRFVLVDDVCKDLAVIKTIMGKKDDKYAQLLAVGRTVGQ